MKTITIFCWALIFLSSTNLLFSTVFPNYSLSIANQEVIGRDVHFDVFVQNTDTAQTIYFSSAYFVLNFNIQYFSNPTLTLIPATNTKFADTTKYVFTNRLDTKSPQITIYLDFAGNFTFQYADPSKFPDSLVISEMNNKLEVLNVGRRVKVLHCIVSGISDTNGTFGLNWFNKSLTNSSFMFGMFKSDKNDHGVPIGSWIQKTIFAKDTSFFIQPQPLPLKLGFPHQNRVRNVRAKFTN